MKRLIFSIAMLCCIGASAQQYEYKEEEKAQNNRPLSEWRDIRCQLFNFGWKFQLGNTQGAESADYDDSNWRTLDLPHDFQFEQPWDEQAKGARGFKQMCEGWYRKTFDIPASYKGMSVLLDFGGIMYYGDVYVNGKKVAIK